MMSLHDHLDEQLTDLEQQEQEAETALVVTFVCFVLIVLIVMGAVMDRMWNGGRVMQWLDGATAVKAEQLYAPSDRTLEWQYDGVGVRTFLLVVDGISFALDWKCRQETCTAPLPTIIGDRWVSLKVRAVGLDGRSDSRPVVNVAVQQQEMTKSLPGRAGMPDTVVVLRVVKDTAMLCAQRSDSDQMDCRSVKEARAWLRERPAVKR
jgi:hypothetical protein